MKKQTVDRKVIKPTDKQGPISNFQEPRFDSPEPQTEDGLLLFDGKTWRPINITERQILSHLEGYDLSGFTDAEKTRSMGSMKQIPFAEAIMKHIYHDVLMRSPVYNKALFQ